jgi:hypothetical protein
MSSTLNLPSTSPRKRSPTVHVLPDGDERGIGELGIGAYFVPQPKHELMSWEHIQRVVAQDDLDYLVRHKDCETRYIAWGEGIRKKYGGLENYMRLVRLDWGEDDDTSPGTPNKGMNGSKIENVNDVEADVRSYFSDVVAEDPTLVKTIPNDWPYAMPAECGHYVVWCKRLILDKALFATKDTPFPKGPIREAIFAAINFDGIRGLTGSSNKIQQFGFKTRNFLKESDEAMAWMKETYSSEQSEEEQLCDLAEKAQGWAGRFIDRFVKKRWPEDNWETAYFCNPPHLRTVPGVFKRSMSLMTFLLTFLSLSLSQVSVTSSESNVSPNLASRLTLFFLLQRHCPCKGRQCNNTSIEIIHCRQALSYSHPFVHYRPPLLLHIDIDPSSSSFLRITSRTCLKF